MNWIFQAIPNRYSLKEKLIEENVETWLVTRYRNEMNIGDTVYFWQAGSSDRRGFYGKGEIISDCKYYSDWGYGIKVRYTMKLNNIIKAQTIKNQIEFSNHMIIKMPIGTNFKLSDSETAVIERLIKDQS